MQNRILVTGGTGLLGSHLLFRLIKKGLKVKATCRKTSNRELVKKIITYYSPEANSLYDLIEWVECDLTDYDSVKVALYNIDKVYHCAAMVSFDVADKEKLLINNINATSNIVRACIENNVLRLCHVSSIAALGGSDGNLNINEEHIRDKEKFSSSYSISKYLSEQEVWKGIHAGLKAVIVLPSIILGPGDWEKSSAAIFGTIAKGLPFYTDGIKGYVDVNDVVDSMIILTESDITGERFIVNGENVSNSRLFAMIAHNLHVRKPFIRIPSVMRFIILPVIGVMKKFSAKKLPLTREILNSAWTKTGYDSSKITSVTGISFKPVEDTIREIASIYLKENTRSKSIVL